jgi:hypothetical protein
MEHEGEPKKRWYDSLPVSKFTLVGLVWLLGAKFFLKSGFARRFPELAVAAFCVLTLAALAIAILMPAKPKEDDGDSPKQ